MRWHSTISSIAGDHCSHIAEENLCRFLALQPRPFSLRHAFRRVLGKGIAEEMGALVETEGVDHAVGHAPALDDIAEREEVASDFVRRNGRCQILPFDDIVAIGLDPYGRSRLIDRRGQ
ncbi:hypothetical protein P7228_08095 [Altererythrobacter arenosus]|uniref:Uncharacterized protein n=1 Tax=Altererythrobacter arenosus TaxID=3032592 RepID=A0ABY8FLS7_9SPHN|nr:hypothetical protein [Altererythrobacter sp. CAU 1644]WFL75971.1 hypothetical protein P7228_08095 [Altererythrobacter sp. CAU 1644]